MAKIKFGMMMTDARGKLGGQVFSKNRSGAYVRTKVTPSNPRSARQSLVRQSLGAISASWSGLSNAQINTWTNAVSAWVGTNIFGDNVAPSGKTLFVKLNLNLANVGLPPITSAPPKLDMPLMGEPLVFFNIPTGYTTLTEIGIPPDAKLIISATPKLSRGTRFYKGKFRQIAVIDADIADGYEVGTPYAAKFGTITQGDNIAFEFKFVLENGQMSVPQVVVMT